jgi:hypothetical protein
MRKWVVATIALISVCVANKNVAAIALAAPAASIIEVSDQEELRRQFCAADARTEHILVLPAALFVDSEELVCPVGPYRLYRIVVHAEPDDLVYFIDPPFGSAGRLACDGKAGRTMKVVAVNCRPE